MRFIHRKNIDPVKWDELVERSGGAVFSTATYLDAVAQNWAILIEGDYKSGIALPYTERFGVKTLYTPVFLRYLEFLNGKVGEKELQLIQSHFSIGELQIRNIQGSFSSIEKQFQEIRTAEQYRLNEQGRRMVRKFEKSDLHWDEVEDTEHVLQSIASELPKKISSLNSSMNELRKLTMNLKANGCLKTFVVKQNDLVLGGIFFVEFGDRVLYLKSAFTHEAKQSGAMYAILDKMIQSALEKGKVFDFGGSNVENVRRFNLHFGAEDVKYQSVQWGELPFWYKFLKRLRQVLKRG